MSIKEVDLDRGFMRIKCDECTRLTKLVMPGATLQEMLRKLYATGWREAGKKHACPDCSVGRR